MKFTSVFSTLLAAAALVAAAPAGDIDAPVPSAKYCPVQGLETACDAQTIIVGQCTLGLYPLSTYTFETPSGYTCERYFDLYCSGAIIVPDEFGVFGYLEAWYYKCTQSA